MAFTPSGVQSGAANADGAAAMGDYLVGACAYPVNGRVHLASRVAQLDGPLATNCSATVRSGRLLRWDMLRSMSNACCGSIL